MTDFVVLTGSIGITTPWGATGVIPVGVLGRVMLPYGVDLSQWHIVCDPSATMSLDIKRVSYSSYGGALGSIVASAPPNVAGAVKANSSTLTGWTTALAKNDILEISVTANDLATWFSFKLEGERNGL